VSVKRKAEHLNVTLNYDVAAKREEGWDDVYLIHECLPEINREDIDLSAKLCGHVFRYPLMISAITGGCPEASTINEALAKAAEHFGIGIELGSQAPLISSPEMEYTYTIAREVAPSAFLVANIGASRLIEQPGHTSLTLAQIQHLIDTIRADAIAIHLNFLQEAVMPEGDSRAKGCLDAIKMVAEKVSVPVMVKETGAGISRNQAAQLLDSGISVLDIGGAGGSSMALLESHRARLNGHSRHERLGSTFGYWGIPTVVSLMETANHGLPVIASGGITNGLEGAKALALGAGLVGVARPLLQVAVKGYEAVVDWLNLFFEELSVAMFLSSASSIAELREKRLVILGRTREWLEQLGYDLPEYLNHRDCRS